MDVKSLAVCTLSFALAEAGEEALKTLVLVGGGISCWVSSRISGVGTLSFAVSDLATQSLKELVELSLSLRGALLLAQCLDSGGEFFWEGSDRCSLRKVLVLEVT